MRRVLLACLFAFGAGAALAANPFYLDQSGVLWQGSSNSTGLLLSATKDGSELVNTVVPFAVGIAGSNDAQIQVVADELTGKVAVVWQRNWAPGASEIMMAVWKDGNWLRVDHLSQDVQANPRYPAIRLTQITSTVPDPTNPGQAMTISDSFLHVVWWEGSDQAHGEYGVLCLTADPDDPAAYTEQNLDGLIGLGIGCGVPTAPDVIEHPTFVSPGAADHAAVFYASQRLCVFLLLDVRFTLQPPDPGASAGNGVPVVTQRRRHMPIFGLAKMFPLTHDLDMDGARVVLGSNLAPVVYRVAGPTLEYVSYSDLGWSPRRTLNTNGTLTLDQAIPLVENLAR